MGRQEERDIVDVMLLERDAKLRVEDFLSAALAKDGGCTPATLAWSLSEIRIDDKARLPAGTSPDTLRAYVSSLVVRLRRIVLPER